MTVVLDFFKTLRNNLLNYPTDAEQGNPLQLTTL